MKIEDFKPWLKAPFSNMVPVAVIGSINPDFALHKDEVFFTGYGIDDGAIRRYIWISDIDGEIWNSTETADFNTTNLSRGAHVITLIVLDNFGIRSNEVSGTLHINEKPKAIIETISPNPALDVDTVTFTCSGSDGDGVADESDAFPNDPVASKDSDGDGYPDEWNTGKSQTDSTTGLKLDYYPDDPKKWKKDSGGESGESEGGIPGFEVITVVGAIGVTMMQYRRKGKDLVNPGRVHFDFL